jgi:NurA-like 5'-3' nuclease
MTNLPVTSKVIMGTHRENGYLVIFNESRLKMEVGSRRLKNNISEIRILAWSVNISLRS